MKRAVAVALLAVLATAAPAAAAHPGLRVEAWISPPVQLFGNPVKVHVSATSDTTRVDPARLRVSANFAPYVPVGPPQKVQSGSGRYVQTTWTWTVRCLTAACVPVTNDVSQVFQFPPVHIRGVGIDGKGHYRAHPFLPRLEVVSQVSPREKAYIEKHKHIQWRYEVTPAVGDSYRLPPGLVFWLAVALAGLCGATAVVLAGRWALRLRTPLAAAGPAVPGSYLERALALFFWANARGDETLQRKALERVADELPLDVVDLSDVARELAWSPETPEGEAVEAISEHAGVQVHHDGGRGE
jgi:hypothetical protein